MEKTFSGQINKRIDNLSTCTTRSVKFILANASKTNISKNRLSVYKQTTLSCLVIYMFLSLDK